MKVYNEAQSGGKVSGKRVQRINKRIKSILNYNKKFRAHNNKKVVDGLENVLNGDFTTVSISGKWD